jgi:hypothetical protein
MSDGVMPYRMDMASLCLVHGNKKHTLGIEPVPALANADWTDSWALIQCDDLSGLECSELSPRWEIIGHPTNEPGHHTPDFLVSATKMQQPMLDGLHI